MQSLEVFARIYFRNEQTRRPNTLVGMSGYLVSEELRGLKKKFGIHFGHQPLKPTENVTEYYPHFEEKLRVEASVMARHYELFYCLENAIGSLISETLQESAGANWWNSGNIPENIKKEVSERMKRDVDSGMTRRSDHAIDYTNFGELSVIIISTGNCSEQYSAVSELWRG